MPDRNWLAHERLLIWTMLSILAIGTLTNSIAIIVIGRG